MKGRKVGEIYCNNEGEGFIVWDETFTELALSDTTYGIDVLQDIEASATRLLEDAQEIQEANTDV